MSIDSRQEDPAAQPNPHAEGAPATSPSPATLPSAATPDPGGAPESAATPESTGVPESAATPESTGAPESAATPESTGSPAAPSGGRSGAKTTRERAEEKRQEKLDLVRQQVESGSLVIRTMTDEERKRYPPRDDQPKRLPRS
jgi:hypothetical protein